MALISTSPLSRQAASIHWFAYAAPQRFYPLAGRIARICAWLAAALVVTGLAMGLGIAPTDAQQGEAYRIIFVHVPVAWMSMVIYVAMAFWAGIGLAFNARLASMLALALAPTGALMTFLALWTGALWGQPTWGTWWVWDARLTSELILLFLYLGFISLHGAIDDARRADRAAAVLALVGVINVPIIYFSVKWWNTLHQGASISLSKSPSMATAMLAAMLVMVLAVWMYCIAITLVRLRTLLLERERDAAWVRRILEAS
ncbi:heme ABC transporter permease CcmC [Variovorax sp. GT1P44]|uniref:heme ABC transporter permease CcmC n=1 Tax=Variovorax sp. GT1P44 TaxID=3443742 RepID=UPI003F460808